MKKYFIITFGCQMNESDSERIASFLEKKRYKKSFKIDEADLIVVNMCSVRQSAVDRVYGLFPKLKKIKAKKIITGCILEKDRQKLLRFFDQALEIKDFLKDNNYLKINPKYSNNISANIPIMTGCNNFCSYCVVPHTREREISRPAEEIICEIKKLVNPPAGGGYKEIWLLGQNVNSYKDPSYAKATEGKVINFPELLKMVSDIPGDFWIRFTSSHPKDFSDELIKVMAKSEKITNYLNLPVQAGDDGILKKMNRPYTIKDYKNIVKKVRKAIPNITLSTDIIVGFPGETKKQFENSVNLFKEIKFDMAYISQYSPRRETSAFKMKDNISKKEKIRRAKVLTKVLEKTALEKNKKLIEKTMEVLIDGKKGENIFIGKTKDYKSIRIESNKDIIGKIVKAEIIKVFPWGLKGKLKNEKKLIVILGANASGKTSLSIKLAKKYNGEIISADSRQVYKGMDIGTGKITKKEMEGIPHYLIDVADPKKRFTVSDYKKQAEKAIGGIFKKNKIPFIVGGTGFYIQSITDGFIIPKVEPDWNFRKKLDKKSKEELFKKLEKLDPKRAKNIDRHNKRRLIRAIEIVIKTKKPVPEIIKTAPLFDILFLGVKRNQEELKSLIEKRLLKRLICKKCLGESGPPASLREPASNAKHSFAGWQASLAKRCGQGMLNEAKKLRKSGVSWKRMEEFGLEYRYMALYLQKKITYEEFLSRLQKEIEHYAKRQMTWFKKDKRIKWIKDYKEAEKTINKFL